MATLYPVIGLPRVVGRDLDLPEEVRREAGICDGEMVVLRKSPDGLLITVIDPDQAWFWTPEWQAGERAIEERLVLGEQGATYRTEEEIEAAFDAVDAELDS